MTSGRVVLCAFRNVSSILQKTPCHRSLTFKPHLYSSINNYSSLQLNVIKKFSSIPHPSQQQPEDDLYKKIVIELKGHDLRVLKSYSAFMHMAAACLQIDECKTYRPPKIIDKLSLNKSAHIFKKHRVQYETRTHFFTSEFFHLTGSTASVFLEYIERNLPEGMAMKVSMHKLEELPEHIRCRPSDGEEESPAEADQTQVNGELYETLIQEQCSDTLTEQSEQSEGTYSEREPDREAEVMVDETIQAAQQTGQEEIQEEEIIERDKASQPPGQTEEEEVLKAKEETTELDETENLIATDSKDSSNIDSHSSSESDSKLDSGSDSDSGSGYESDSGSDSDSDLESGSGNESDSDSDSESDSGNESDSDSDSESGSGFESDSDSDSDSKPGSDSDSNPESDSIPDSNSKLNLGIDSDTGRPERS